MLILTTCFLILKCTNQNHFTSYWRYCFLHSGVMWDERCSANFMLPEQLSPQSSSRSASGCPLCRRRDFCYFQSTWLAQHAVRQPGALRCFLTPLPVGHGPCTPSRSRPAYYFTEARQWPLSDGCSFFFHGTLDEPARVAQWLCCVPPRASLRTLRSAIALSHKRRGCVSRARSSTGRWWDLL